MDEAKSITLERVLHTLLLDGKVTVRLLPGDIPKFKARLAKLKHLHNKEAVQEGWPSLDGKLTYICNEGPEGLTEVIVELVPQALHRESDMQIYPVPNVGG